MLRFVHPLLWYTPNILTRRLLRSRFVAAFFPSAESKAERTIEKANSQKQGKADCPKGEFSHFLSRPEPENKKKCGKKEHKKSKLRTAWRNEHQTGRLRLCEDFSTRSFAEKIRNKCERIFYTPNTLKEINGFLRTRNSTESTEQNST